jgi:WD40 repeat protein
VCDVASGEWVYKAEGGALAYGPDGRWLAVVNTDEDVLVLIAAFNPDGRRLATCSQDRTVRQCQIGGGGCEVLRGHTDEVFAAAFHPDGTRLATASRFGAVWLWDLERGEDVARLPGHASFVWSVAFSPDGKSLASGGDATVRLWDTAPLKERYQVRREVEAARPEAARLVRRLLAELGGPGRVASRLRTDPALSDALRRAASQELQRRASK